MQQYLQHFVDDDVDQAFETQYPPEQDSDIYRRPVHPMRR
jgi:hypothetical protein